MFAETIGRAVGPIDALFFVPTISTPPPSTSPGCRRG